MRILIVTHVVAKNDGQGRVNYEIVRSALAGGCHVTLVASHVDPAIAAHPQVRWVRMAQDRVPSRLLQYQLFALRSGLWIRRHRQEFDIVHLNGFIAWAKADVNSVHFVHDGWYRCGSYPFSLTGGWYGAYQVIYTRLNAMLERIAFAHARVIVPVSEKVADEVRALGVAASGAIEVIHNGADIAEFTPGDACRARFGLPDGANGESPPLMLLFAGDLRLPRKNLDSVLRALVQLPSHVHLAVAGALAKSVYPQLASKLGVAGRVHFLDMVKDMPALMRSVDMLVFPSRYEAMSLVLVEALASGLPVVTARSAGGAEVITDDCGVVLDDPNDVDALASAIAALDADRVRVACMRDAARARSLALSSDAMGARYVELYRRIAGQREAPANSAVPV